VSEAQQVLVPPAATAPAQPRGHLGVAFGPRFFLLLILGLLWIGPAFAQPRFLYATLAWDVLVLIAWSVDLARLPRPAELKLTRSWEKPPALSVGSKVDVSVHNDSRVRLHGTIVDDVPPALRPSLPVVKFTVPPRNEAAVSYVISPSRRGDVEIGAIHLRYESAYRIAQRWAVVPVAQRLRIYPNLDEARKHSIYLVRSRQIEMEKRYTRLRGAGREFESLREYRESDELRDICWTASARRAKLVAKQYQIERSQTIWIVVDSGRLMRAHVNHLSKLDYAANAALSLAQVALFSGDRVGLLAYGRRLQHRLAPGRGRNQLRPIVEALAQAQEETSEADHLQAAAALMAVQKRRSLVVWLTDLAETAMTPDVVEGASQLMPPHLLLFVVIGQPDLAQRAAGRPLNPTEMYATTAAHEVMYRRELLLARLRERGAFALEVSAGKLSPTVVNSYLEVKQRSRL
jgi:uncharacterized protein (DUF58 family)